MIDALTQEPKETRPDRPPTSRAEVTHVMARNAAANFFRLGTSFIIALLLPPILVRLLDKSTFASWTLVIQIGLYITLVDSSLQSAIARFVARSHERRDREELARVMSSSTAMLGLLSLVSVLLIAVVSFRLAHLFPQIPGFIVHGARFALLILGFSIALSLPFSALAGYFWGMQRNGINAVVSSSAKFVGAAGTAWAAYNGHGLLAMAGWTGFGNVLQCMLYLGVWKRFGDPGAVHWAKAQRSTLKELALFCSAALVSQVTGIFITGMDLPIVAYFDFKTVAYYGIAATFSNFMVAPHGAILSTLMPVAAGLSASNDSKRLGSVLVKATRYSTALVCIIGIPLLFAMPILIRLWVGTDYAIHTVPFATILVIAQMIRLTFAPFATVAFSAGQQHKTLYSPLAEAIVNVACSVVGAAYFGAIGVAVGTLIGALVGVAVHLLISIPRTDRVSVQRAVLMLEGIGRPLKGVVPAVLIWVVLRPWSHMIATQVIETVLIGSFAIVAICWTSFESSEGTEIAHIVMRLLKIRRKSQPVPTGT
jgi:O-antigen/teichoic acid export membrane protein